MPSALEKNLYKLIAAVMGMSLSVNAWLVKERVTEISDNLKELNQLVDHLRISMAVTSDTANKNEQRIERLRELEARIILIEGRLGVARQRR